MTGLVGQTNLKGYKGDIYQWNDGPKAGALDIDDRFKPGDLGHNGDLRWEQETREYLDDPANSDVNVVIWSWCGGCSDNTPEGIQTYLNAMDKLEKDYPNVKFVYMTGHRDIWNDDTLKRNNNLIRDYCREHGKILYDFADIESWDPDNKYFEFANDNCNYYKNNYSNEVLGNWADEWQESHTEGVDWYTCDAAHTRPLNANRKAYAAWWLWCRLAGWEGNTNIDSSDNIEFNLLQNEPNPCFSHTSIRYSISSTAFVELKLYNAQGKLVKTLIHRNLSKGEYSIDLNTDDLAAGLYIYTLTIKNRKLSRRLIVVK